MSLLVLPLALAACRAGGAQETPEVESSVVRAVAVVERTMRLPIVATGTLGPKEEIALSFKAGGVIERVAVDAGETVQAGQQLAQLELREIDAAVMRARSAADKAERDLARARRLFADSVVALAQLQDAETAAQVARADLEAATFNRRYAAIVAPAAGVILRRSAEPGETVSPGATVLVLGSRARGSVLRAGLPDRDVLRVRRGDSAQITFDALPGRTFAGTVADIGAAAQAGTGTYAVEIAVHSASGLAAGMVGSVEIRSGDELRAAMVPIEAILEADGDAATVFVLSADGTRAQRRRVTIAGIYGDHVAVISGIEPGARVVTDGAAWLNDGAAVRVLQ